MTDQPNAIPPNEPTLIYVCQESACTFVGTSVEEYNAHRKETDHFVKLMKKPLDGVVVGPPQLSDQAIELANMVISEGGQS